MNKHNTNHKNPSNDGGSFSESLSGSGDPAGPSYLDTSVEATTIELTDGHEISNEFKNLFSKASEFSLTPEEKIKGAEALKAFMAKEAPGALAGPQVESQSVAKAASVKSPYGFFSGIFVNRQSMMYAVVAACFIFAFVTGTAYAANTSLPGDLLYPVKVSVKEPVERALAFSPAAKARVVVAQATERLKEAEQLAAAGKIDSSNEVAINDGIARSADAVQYTTMVLTEKGQTEAALEVNAKYEESVNAFREKVTSIAASNGNAGLALASSLVQNLEHAIASRGTSSAGVMAMAKASGKISGSEKDDHSSTRESSIGLRRNVMSPAARGASDAAGVASDIRAAKNPVIMFSATLQTIAPATSTTTGTSTASSTASTTTNVGNNANTANTSSVNTGATAATAVTSSPTNTNAASNASANTVVQTAVPAAAAVVAPVVAPVAPTITNTMKSLGI